MNSICKYFLPTRDYDLGCDSALTHFIYIDNTHLI